MARPRSPLALLRTLIRSGVGPGLLVAATGVGAGDLATASIAGSRLGVAVLWAVLLGAFLKFALNEGLARWQLATGETLVEGAARRLGRPLTWLFLAYLAIWTFTVCRALASACGVTAHALVPVFDDPRHGQLAFGAAHAVGGVALVLAGGYRLFERVMGAAIGLMFVTTLVTAARLGADPGAVARGLVTPAIPPVEGGLAWTVALLGGVGGTVTLLCYGYWIREEGLEGPGELRRCRLDLATGYFATALFGAAMVVIGSTVTVEGGGAGLLVTLGDRLGESLGVAGRALFLAGAWAAVASSLLGVWQAVPYLFADLWRLLAPGRGRVSERVDSRGPVYRGVLAAMGVAALLGLATPFVQAQKVYAVVGALFIPALAAVLLVLNGRSAWIGAAWRNRPATTALLAATLALFAWLAWASHRGP